jgi:hypothetical protein
MTATRRVNAHPNLGTLQQGDVVLGERTSGTTGLFTVPSLSGGGGGAVDSVNSQTGVVVLDADDISDTSTTNKYVTSAEKTKLSNLSGTNSGDQTITLTGDVTGSGTGSFAATIANDAVTYAKIQNVSVTDRLLGRSTIGAGDVEEIVCTAAGRALIDDADASAQRTTLGLGTLATQSGTFSGTSSGTNTGDQTSIVGITGTKAQFNTAVTDGDILYSGDAYVPGGTDVSVADGGTGRSVTVAYAPIVGGTTTTGAMQSTAVGSAGQVLQSGGASAVPTYSTATYPSTAGTSGKRLKSDGTNIVTTTTTMPDTGTTGKVLIGDGTNYVESTPKFPNASATTRKIIVSDGTDWTASTETYAAPGAAGARLTSDGTNWARKGGLTAFKATRNTNQSIARATHTKVQYATETFDTGGMYDNATNYRYTPTVAGKYVICMFGLFDGAFTLGSRVVFELYKNGALYAYYTTIISATNGFVSGSLTDIFDMNGSTDYVEGYVYQDDVSGSRNLLGGAEYNYLSGCLIEAT